MLHALDEARTETEATLVRQREFVADASHELRTPLTSVLANLELLEETLKGEHARGRRLRAALQPPDAPPGGRPAAAGARRRRPRADRAPTVDLAERRGRRRRPSSSRSRATTRSRSRPPPGVEIEGVQDELHRLVLNLMENALRHTDPGTAVEASVERRNGAGRARGRGRRARDPARAAARRSSSASSARTATAAGSSGLGLSIVKAVAESHQGTVTLEPPLDGRGARFVVRFPAAATENLPTPQAAAATCRW